MKLKQLFIPMFILVISFFIPACGQQKDKWQGTIEEIDGVTVVKNPIEPIYIGDVLELEEDLSIGEKEGREEYMFTRILIDIDDDENIYVLDGETANIRIFDRYGKFIQTISRRGQGPGELQSPRRIQITPQDEIMVYDSGNRRLSFFSLDGKFINQIVVGRVLAILSLKIDSNRNFIISEIFRGGTELRMYDSEFNPGHSLFNIESITPGVLNLINYFAYFSLTSEDNIIWGYSDKYELNVVDSGGKVIKKILKEYNPTKITDKDKEMLMNERYGSRGVPEGFTLRCPENYPPFKNLVLDNKGRIFVETFEKCEGGGCYSDIFDTEGRYIGKARLGMNPIWLVWKKGKLYTIERDEEGYQYVKRYKVTWNY